MCGRFSLYADEKLLKELFDFHFTDSIAVRYNIAPSQYVLAVVFEDGKRVGKLFKWGLVPYWANDPKIGFKMINARAETLSEKPSFKDAFKKRRCLILADGFYEWKKEDGKKIPYRFTMRDGKSFAFAGIWERNEKFAQPLYTCTVITTTPNELVKGIHDRMPVIVPENLYETWLDPKMNDTEYLRMLLCPYPSEQMKVFEVSTLINSPKNDAKECVEEV